MEGWGGTRRWIPRSPHDFHARSYGGALESFARLDFSRDFIYIPSPFLPTAPLFVYRSPTDLSSFVHFLSFFLIYLLRIPYQGRGRSEERACVWDNVRSEFTIRIVWRKFHANLRVAVHRCPGMRRKKEEERERKVSPGKITFSSRDTLNIRRDYGNNGAGRLL